MESTRKEKKKEYHRPYFHTLCDSSPLDSVSSRIGHVISPLLKQIIFSSCVYFFSNLFCFFFFPTPQTLNSSTLSEARLLEPLLA